MKKRLFLIIDGHAILHRAYHAIPLLTSKNSQPVNAVFGFFSMFLSIVKEISPSAVIVCFDTPTPTFRHLEYVGYQHKRKPTEEALVGQIDVLQQALISAKIPIYSRPGFEADDVIATVSKKLGRKAKARVIILSGDKDLMQLVNRKVSLATPQKGIAEMTIYDPKAVEAKLGITPKQVVDYKALVGDNSDNYPGVSGIGPKTAVSLLQKYGSFENIYRHCGDFTENMRRKMETGREGGVLSEKLAKIVDNVPIKINTKRAVFGPKKIKCLKATLEKLGFRSLVRRLEKDFGIMEEKAKGPEQIKLI